MDDISLIKIRIIDDEMAILFGKRSNIFEIPDNIGTNQSLFTGFARETLLNLTTSEAPKQPLTMARTLKQPEETKEDKEYDEEDTGGLDDEDEVLTLKSGGQQIREYDKDDILRDELMLYMTDFEYNALLEHADKYLNAEFCQQNIEAGVNDYNILLLDTISKYHIIALIVYCNNLEMRKALDATYKRQKGENDTDLSKRHCNLYHLTKLLRESVKCYGIEIHQSQNKLFYHRIKYDSKIINKMNSLFIYPFLTSNPMESISINNNNDDLIIEVKDYVAKYFDCRWISELCTQKEMIFGGGNRALTIDKCINTKYGFDHKVITNSIKDIPRTSDYKSDDIYHFYISGSLCIGFAREVYYANAPRLIDIDNLLLEDPLIDPIEDPKSNPISNSTSDPMKEQSKDPTNEQLLIQNEQIINHNNPMKQSNEELQSDNQEETINMRDKIWKNRRFYSKLLYIPLILVILAEYIWLLPYLVKENNTPEMDVINASPKEEEYNNDLSAYYTPEIDAVNTISSSEEPKIDPFVYYTPEIDTANALLPSEKLKMDHLAYYQSETDVINTSNINSQKWKYDESLNKERDKEIEEHLNGPKMDLFAYYAPEIEAANASPEEEDLKMDRLKASTKDPKEDTLKEENHSRSNYTQTAIATFIDPRGLSYRYLSSPTPSIDGNNLDNSCPGQHYFYPSPSHNSTSKQSKTTTVKYNEDCLINNLRINAQNISSTVNDNNGDTLLSHAKSTRTTNIYVYHADAPRLIDIDNDPFGCALDGGGKSVMIETINNATIHQREDTFATLQTPQPHNVESLNAYSMHIPSPKHIIGGDCNDPKEDPTKDPNKDPTKDSKRNTTKDPNRDPSRDPTKYPKGDPTKDPNRDPTKDPKGNTTKDPHRDPSRFVKLLVTFRRHHSIFDNYNLHQNDYENDDSDSYVFAFAPVSNGRTDVNLSYSKDLKSIVYLHYHSLIQEKEWPHYNDTALNIEVQIYKLYNHIKEIIYIDETESTVPSSHLFIAKQSTINTLKTCRRTTKVKPHTAKRNKIESQIRQSADLLLISQQNYLPQLCTLTEFDLNESIEMNIEKDGMFQYDVMHDKTYLWQVIIKHILSAPFWNKEHHTFGHSMVPKQTLYPYLTSADYNLTLIKTLWKLFNALTSTHIEHEVESQKELRILSENVNVHKLVSLISRMRADSTHKNIKINIINTLANLRDVVAAMYIIDDYTTEILSCVYSAYNHQIDNEDDDDAEDTLSMYIQVEALTHDFKFRTKKSETPWQLRINESQRALRLLLEDPSIDHNKRLKHGIHLSNRYTAALAQFVPNSAIHSIITLINIYSLYLLYSKELKRIGFVYSHYHSSIQEKELTYYNDITVLNIEVQIYNRYNRYKEMIYIAENKDEAPKILTVNKILNIDIDSTASTAFIMTKEPSTKTVIKPISFRPSVSKSWTHTLLNHNLISTTNVNYAVLRYAWIGSDLRETVCESECFYINNDNKSIDPINISNLQQLYLQETISHYTFVFNYDHRLKWFRICNSDASYQSLNVYSEDTNTNQNTEQIKNKIEIIWIGDEYPEIEALTHDFEFKIMRYNHQKRKNESVYRLLQKNLTDLRLKNKNLMIAHLLIEILSDIPLDALYEYNIIYISYNTIIEEEATDDIIADAFKVFSINQEIKIETEEQYVDVNYNAQNISSTVDDSNSDTPLSHAMSIPTTNTYAYHANAPRLIDIDNDLFGCTLDEDGESLMIETMNNAAIHRREDTFAALQTPQPHNVESLKAYPMRIPSPKHIKESKQLCIVIFHHILLFKWSIDNKYNMKQSINYSIIDNYQQCIHFGNILNEIKHTLNGSCIHNKQTNNNRKCLLIKRTSDLYEYNAFYISYNTIMEKDRYTKIDINPINEDILYKTHHEYHIVASYRINTH